MNSIRPLATITLLACAGVVLYLKINESPPVLPEELGEWSNTLEVDSVLSGDVGGATEFGSSDPFAGSTFGGSPQAAGPAGGAAPSWSPPPADATTTAPAANAMSTETETSVEASITQSDVAMPDVPEMPDLPPFGGDPSIGGMDGEGPAGMAPTGDQAHTRPSTGAQAVAPVTPTVTQTSGSAGALSAYASARAAIHAALDRGELSKALLLATEWYGDPSLTPPEAAEVGTLLSQLAGTVIYSTEPRLEAPYIVRAGETLQDVADRYNVPWQLLAKINGISQPDTLQPGQQLKVLRGPFSAFVDLSRRELTLMLDRRYAGRFAIEFDPQITVEEGAWTVDQKLLTPAGSGLYGSPGETSEDRSIVLANASAPGGQIAVLRGPEPADLIAAAPSGRTIRLKSTEVGDVYDILSIGSQVVIRR